MRVIVPYAKRHIEPVWSALILTGAPVNAVSVRGSDRAYYDLLAELWRRGDTFGIVEHDIVVNQDTLAELAECEHDWCAMPFNYMGRVTYGLACAKFSADLIARHPDALERVGVIRDERHEKRHWCRLDAWLTVVLNGDGEKRHEHTRMVQHLNPGCSHGCTTVA